MTALEVIHIFKTNIRTPEDFKSISDVLNTEALIKFWSIDMEDVDKVLRVNSPFLKQEEIIRLVTSKGFTCCELE